MHQVEDDDGKIKCDCGCYISKKLNNHKKTKEHQKK
jgi:hypothetical protein